MTRKVKELKEWLNQFNDEDEVWAYEGEVQGIIIEHKRIDYTFHNSKIPEIGPSTFAYPQEPSPRKDENIEE